MYNWKNKEKFEIVIELLLLSYNSIHESQVIEMIFSLLNDFYFKIRDFFKYIIFLFKKVFSQEYILYT